MKKRDHRHVRETNSQCWRWLGLLLLLRCGSRTEFNIPKIWNRDKTIPVRGGILRRRKRRILHFSIDRNFFVSKIVWKTENFLGSQEIFRFRCLNIPPWAQSYRQKKILRILTKFSDFWKFPEIFKLCSY